MSDMRRVRQYCWTGHGPCRAGLKQSLRGGADRAPGTRRPTHMSWKKLLDLGRRCTGFPPTFRFRTYRGAPGSSFATACRNGISGGSTSPSSTCARNVRKYKCNCASSGRMAGGYKSEFCIEATRPAPTRWRWNWGSRISGASSRAWRVPRRAPCLAGVCRLTPQ